jgi:hypothetical protein
MEISMAVSSEMLRLIFRRVVVPLAFLAWVAAGPFRLAQEEIKPLTVPTEGIDRRDPLSMGQNEPDTSKLDLSVSVDSTDNIDCDFVTLKLPDHQGAIDKACIEVRMQRSASPGDSGPYLSERRNEWSLMRDSVGDSLRAEASDAFSGEPHAPPVRRLSAARMNAARIVVPSRIWAL